MSTEQRTAIQSQDEIVSLKGCPDCKGRGWFLINPFATGGTNGLGGIGNMRHCETCVRSHQHWKQHGCLPLDVVERLTPEACDSIPLSDEQISILDHTLHRASARAYCGDSPAMQDLVRRELMVSAGKVSFCPDEYFRITAKGREAWGHAKAND